MFFHQGYFVPISPVLVYLSENVNGITQGRGTVGLFNRYCGRFLLPLESKQPIPGQRGTKACIQLLPGCCPVSWQSSCCIGLQDLPFLDCPLTHQCTFLSCLHPILS